MPSNSRLAEAAESIARAGRSIHARGWVPATSGNFSMRLADNSVAITVSGTDKGDLSDDDVMEIDLDGHSNSSHKSSAETGLHLQLYRRDPNIAAILHTHSIHATLCSQQVDTELSIAGLELLKAFDGISSHESSLSLPVFDNTQDMAALSRQVEDHMAANGQGHGYLIRGHGLYTWGPTMQACMRHLEALEFLLEYYFLSNGVARR